MNYEELTIRQMQDKLVELGLDETAAKSFSNRTQLMVTLDLMQKNKGLESKPAEPQVLVGEEVPAKVVNINEKPDPVEEKNVNRLWKTKAEVMRDKLLAQEHVKLLIPLEPGEKQGVVEWRTDKNGIKYQVHVSGAIRSPILNGYKFLIPKGTYYPVPIQIAELIDEAYRAESELGKAIAIDRNDPLTNQPVRNQL